MTTVYNYDELGNETNQIDAAGHTTVFRYDALDRRTGGRCRQHDREQQPRKSYVYAVEIPASSVACSFRPKPS